jgi:bacillithiol synthase
MRFEIYNAFKRPAIARDFAEGADKALQRFDFRCPYGQAQVWQERAEWLDRADRPQASRDELADILLAYNSKHNASPETLRLIEQLRDPGTLVVVGGQQAGLFTGPMLVIYKALTIIQAASDARKRLGRNVIPVFWIAGEDHDWDEVNHTYVLTPQLTVNKIAIAHPAAEQSSAKRTSVSRTLLSPQLWSEALASLEASLQDTEFKPDLMARLRDIAEQSETLSDAFASTISYIFGKYGLVLMDSDDPQLRRIESPMFRQLIERNVQLNGAIQTGQHAVKESGYPLQAEAAADGVQLFLFHDSERKLLFHHDGRIIDRKSTVSLSQEELLRLAAEQPESLSNNALTRPLMQEYVLPVLSTVLGPSEIAYWSSLKEAFHEFGLRTPIIMPRLEFSLLEGTVQKQMSKFNLSFADAVERLDELRGEWLRGVDEIGLEARFDEAKQAFERMYAPLIGTIAEINPGLKKLGETNMNKILEQVDFLQKKALEAHKSQHEAALRHWDRIQLSLLPLGKPQERVCNVFQFAAKYGLEPLLDQLMEHNFVDFDSGTRNHFVIYL